MSFIRMFAVALPLLAPPAAVLAQPVDCPELFAGGQPPALMNPKLAARTSMLCNDAYATLASGVTKGAVWSAERLTSEGLAGARGMQRQGLFHADGRLPADDRAELGDYRRSGYDRGHMAPSGDMPDGRAQQQSFSLANMVPQSAALNRGVWSAIEERVRRLAERRGELFVVTGPAFAGARIGSIGLGGVLVPTSTWKAVHDPGTGGTGAYVCTNTETPVCEVTPVAFLIRTVGIDPFPGVPEREKETAMALPAPGGRRYGHDIRGAGPR